MNSKIILGASLAAVFAVTLVVVVPAFAHLSWQPIVAGSVSITPINPNLTKLSLTASGTVPKNTPDLVGFARLYSSGPNTAYAITSHQSVRDSLANPDGWHAHNVVLGSPGAISTFCVAVVSDAPTAGITLSGSSVTVSARSSTLTGTFSGLAASFDIVADASCPGTGLGIVVHSLTS